VSRYFAIVVVLLLLLPQGAIADRERRIQIPAHPFWITLPDGWKSQADATQPIVSVRDNQGGYMVFRGAAAHKTNLMALEMKRVEQSYGKVLWSAKGKKKQLGDIQRGQRPLQVAISEVMVGRYRLLSTAIVTPEKAQAVFKLQEQVLDSVQHGWVAPAKRWRQLPGGDMQIRLPDTGWQEIMIPNAVKMNSLDGNAVFEAHLRQDSDVKAGAIVEAYAKSLSTAGDWHWTANQKWKHKLKGNGIKRLGRVKASADNQGYSVVLYAYKSRLGIVFIMATARGPSTRSILKQVDQIAASMRPIKR
jgi:hypothetical protein